MARSPPQMEEGVVAASGRWWSRAFCCAQRERGARKGAWRRSTEKPPVEGIEVGMVLQSCSGVPASHSLICVVLW